MHKWAVTFYQLSGHNFEMEWAIAKAINVIMVCVESFSQIAQSLYCIHKGMYPNFLKEATCLTVILFFSDGSKGLEVCRYLTTKVSTTVYMQLIQILARPLPFNFSSQLFTKEHTLFTSWLFYMHPLLSHCGDYCHFKSGDEHIISHDTHNFSRNMFYI